MGSIIAIDIALIPKNYDVIFEYNRRVTSEAKSGFLFDASHRPHITLLQDFIRAEHIDALAQEISELTEKVDFLAPAAVKGFGRGGHYLDDLWAPSIELQKTEPLMALHQEVHGRSQRFSQSQQYSSGLFSEPTNDKCQSYVKNFRSGPSLEKFCPHITLAIAPEQTLGDYAAGLQWPAEIEMDSLVLAQMGHYCTVGSAYKEWKHL